MIIKDLKKILDSFHDEAWAEILYLSGHNLYLVGGCVRDSYRFQSIKDIDIVVENISIGDLSKLLSKYGKVDEVGKSFGVLKFLPRGKSGQPYDISVPRIDLKTGKGHKGFRVKTQGLNIIEDLKRRDFTINSMAVDIFKQELIDPFNGLSDLRLKIIRMIDEEHFFEDPLRILRGIQFASRFRYTITPSTLMMMREKSHLINEIPGERIMDEIMKAIDDGGDTGIIMKLLYQTDLDKVLLGNKIIYYKDYLDKLDFASFFYTLGILSDTDPAEFVKGRLKSSTSVYKAVKGINDLVTGFISGMPDEELRCSIAKSIKESPAIKNSVVLPPEIKDIISLIRFGKIPLTITDLPITGDDVIEISGGELKGRAIGEVLEKLFRDALMMRYQWRSRNETIKRLENLINN